MGYGASLDSISSNGFLPGRCPINQPFPRFIQTTTTSLDSGNTPRQFIRLPPSSRRSTLGSQHLSQNPSPLTSLIRAKVERNRMQQSSVTPTSTSTTNRPTGLELNSIHQRTNGTHNLRRGERLRLRLPPRLTILVLTPRFAAAGH